MKRYHTTALTKGPVNISHYISTPCKGTLVFIAPPLSGGMPALISPVFTLYLPHAHHLTVECIFGDSIANQPSSVVGTKRSARFYFNRTWAKHSSVYSIHLTPTINTSTYWLSGLLPYNLVNIPQKMRSNHECNCQRRHFYPMLCLHTSRTTFDGIRITKDVL